MLRNRLVRLSGDKLFLWIPSLNCWRLDEPALRVRILVVFTGQLQHHMWIFLFQLSISETAWKRLPILFTKTIDIFLLAFSSFFFSSTFLFFFFIFFFSILLYIILYFQHDRSSQKRNNIYFVFSFSFFSFFSAYPLLHTSLLSLFFFSSFSSLTLFHSFHIHSLFANIDKQTHYFGSTYTH